VTDGKVTHSGTLLRKPKGLPEAVCCGIALFANDLTRCDSVAPSADPI
jgi:hypothetical protein